MSKKEELIAKVDELVQLLYKNKEEGWRNFFAKHLQELKNDNGRVLEFIDESFGGMGSFNDLIFQHYENERLVVPKDANQRLGQLKEDIYNLVKELRKLQND